MFNPIFNKYQVGIVDCPLGIKPIALTLLKKVMSLDLILKEIEYRPKQRIPSLCVMHSNFLWDNEATCAFLRDARKAVITTIICIPEFIASQNIIYDYDSIIPFCSDIIYFNTHGIKEPQFKDCEKLVCLVADKIYNVTNKQFLCISFGRSANSIEIINK